METGSGYKYRTEIAFVVAFCKVLHAVMFHFSEFCLFLSVSLNSFACLHLFRWWLCVDVQNCRNCQQCSNMSSGCCEDAASVVANCRGSHASAADVKCCWWRLRSHVACLPVTTAVCSAHSFHWFLSLHKVKRHFCFCAWWLDILSLATFTFYTMCIVCGAGSVNRRRSRILQGRVSNPSERGTGGRAPKVELFPFQWPLI